MDSSILRYRGTLCAELDYLRWVVAPNDKRSITRITSTNSIQGPEGSISNIIGLDLFEVSLHLSLFQA